MPLFLAILTALALALPRLAEAQRLLPACPGPVPSAAWTDCVGSYTFPNGGGSYVGEMRKGKRYGQGTEYAADGKVLRSGIWENDLFVRR